MSWAQQVSHCGGKNHPSIIIVMSRGRRIERTKEKVPQQIGEQFTTIDNSDKNAAPRKRAEATEDTSPRLRRERAPTRPGRGGEDTQERRLNATARVVRDTTNSRIRNEVVASTSNESLKHRIDVELQQTSEQKDRPSRRLSSANTFDFFNSIASSTLSPLFEKDQELDSAFLFSGNDPAALSIIFKQSSSDCEGFGFSVLTLDKYEEEKKKLSHIRSHYKTLQSKLLKEIKSQDDYTDHPSEKIMDLTKELWTAMADIILAERRVMRHICGSIKMKAEEYFSSMSDAPTLRVDRSGQEAKRKLADAEEKVQMLDTQVKKLKAEIQRTKALSSLDSDDENQQSLQSPRRTPRGERVRNGRSRGVCGDSPDHSVVDTLKAELESAKSELKNLDELHSIQLASIQSSHQKEREKLLESVRKSTQEEIESRYEDQLNLLKQQHESKLEDVRQITELEKTESKVSFQKQQLEAKYRLESSEQALVDLKQQFFDEREKLHEVADKLEDKLNSLERDSKKSSEEWTEKKTELEKHIAKLEKEIIDLQASLDGSRKSLESKALELIEIKKSSDAEIQKLTQVFEVKIVEQKEEICELLEVRKHYEDSEKALKESEGRLKASLEARDAEVQNIKLIANQDVYKAQDALFEANDQLDRVQRLLKDVGCDVDRYKKIADERDQDILTLKKSLREKEKELEVGALAGAPESSRLRKLVEQKDADLDSKRAELRSLKTELSTLQRKLEVKDREIEEAKAQIMRVIGSSAEEQTQDIARMHVMLLDLKTSRVDLLEKLDDSQHAVETLKNQLAKLKRDSEVMA